MHLRDVMDKQGNSNIEDRIRDSLRRATDSVDFGELRRTVTDTVNAAVRQAHDGLMGAVRTAAQPKPQKPVIRVRYPSSVGGILCTVFGGVGLGVTAVLMLLCLLGALLLDQRLSTILIGELLLTVPAGMFGALLGVGASMCGTRQRLQRYLRAADDRTYCPVKQLAQASRKSESFVRRDVRRMIRKGFLPESFLDEEGDCLILDRATYEQFLALRERTAQEQAAQAQSEQARAAEAPEDAAARAVVEEGERCLAALRTLNFEIPGEEISRKLDRLEFLLREIFGAVRRRPEQAGELRRFMDYYLPTTLKLVQSYRELDAVAVEGDNIRTAKAEIEATLDTINGAFERLIDELYQDVAFDASTDASVLQSMLAKDGWTGSDFEKEEEQQ